MHPSDAARTKRGLSSLPLPALQIRNPVVSEHSVADVGLSAWQMPELRGAHFYPLFSSGVADGDSVPELLAGFRPSVRVACAGLCDFSGGVDRRDFYRLRAFDHPG